jgi:hypothetical protein
VSSADRPISGRRKISRSADPEIARRADDAAVPAAYRRERVRNRKERPMRNARISLILLGLTFGIWEAVDIFWIDVPAMAALFSALFLACTAWFWRRGSMRAATALLVLFAFEAAAAPSLKHVMTVTKVTDFSLAVAGVLAALAVLATPVRRWATR